MKKLQNLLIFLMIAIQLNAQQDIKGKVVDDAKIPLPGVSVQVKNTLRGTITDVDGNYTILPNPSDTLVFSMVGMVSQTIPVGRQTTIDIVLSASQTILQEVVVIGYGKVRKSDLTGAVSSVKTEELTKITSLNPEQGLQGKVCDRMI